MNYQKHYDLLIIKSKLDFYTETHHILPTCMSGLYADENKVLLSGREHFLAHLLLSKANPDNYKLLKSVVAMSMDKYGNRLLSPRQISIARKANSTASSICMAKTNNRLVAEGKHYSQTAKHKLRASQMITVYNKSDVNKAKVAERNASPEARLRLSARNQQLVTCCHCNKVGKAGGMGRWHFSNCRQVDK